MAFHPHPAGSDGHIGCSVQSPVLRHIRRIKLSRAAVLRISTSAHPPHHRTNVENICGFISLQLSPITRDRFSLPLIRAFLNESVLSADGESAVRGRGLIIDLLGRTRSDAPRVRAGVRPRKQQPLSEPYCENWSPRQIANCDLGSPIRNFPPKLELTIPTALGFLAL
jgi:hypothetical protein